MGRWRSTGQATGLTEQRAGNIYHVAGLTAVTGSAWQFQNRIGVPRLLTLIQAAISAKRGFSFIRLGEGEGTFLTRANDDSSGELSQKLQEWFGSQQFSPREIGSIADMIRASIASADVLGLPTPAQVKKHAGYRRVFSALEAYGLDRSNQARCDANMHWYLQFSGAIASLLLQRGLVSVIGCRVLEKELQRVFHIRSIRTFPVRGEERHPGSVTEPHWPLGFSLVKEQVERTVPGTIFLVGAGPLGKIYCHWVKEKGGVALDIGSLLDGWAGIASRIRYGAFPELFSLAYLNNIVYDETSGQARIDKCVSDLGLETSTY